MDDDQKTPIHIPSGRTLFMRTLSDAVDRFCNIPPESGVVVAVSGGADSMALLAGFHAIARKRHRRWQLHVAHIHHHLRPEADAEAALVEQTAAQLEWPFHRLDVYPQKLAGNASANARQLRYDALKEIARTAHANIIATAHHGTDQLETVLMQLVRGSGINGLSGMAWHRELSPSQGDTSPTFLVRPLLNQTHADCVEFLSTHHWPWLEDISNQDTTKIRNRIRADVLPILQEIAPECDRRVGRTTDQLAQIAALLEVVVRQAVCDLNSVESSAPDGREWACDRTALVNTNPYIRNAVLRHVAQAAGCSMDGLSYAMLEDVVDAVVDHATHLRTFRWPNNVIVEITHNRVSIGT